MASFACSSPRDRYSLLLQMTVKFHLAKGILSFLFTAVLFILVRLPAAPKGEIGDESIKKTIDAMKILIL